MQGKRERKPHHKSESVTIRLDSIIFSKLDGEAQQSDISFNTLISQILRQHTNWHSHAAKAGFISVRKGLLVNLIDRLSEEEITSVAEDIAKRETKDFVLLLRNKYNIESGKVSRCRILYSMIWVETGLFIWQSNIGSCLKNST